ncbi:MAG: hypothetical protein JW771_02915, partial [Candidatus Thermoplasmatota archaeon]|nr:hypothetical protein [Candidatus Thermoplasmatota archaeon]
MLNELCQLADALEHAGVTPKELDPKLKDLPKATPKKPCYRIQISENGTINAIDTISDDVIPFLKKWEPSNGNSFPGFNIQPLYRVAFNENIEEQKNQKKKLKEWKEGKLPIDIDLLKSWCVESNSNWDEKIEKKLLKCLGDIPQMLLQLITASHPGACPEMEKLIERVLHYPFAGKNTSLNNDIYEKSYREALEDYLWQSIETGEQIKIVLPFLLLEGQSDKEPDKDRGGLSVFLDIPDWEDYPVASPKTIEKVNEQLVAGKVKKVNTDIARDAFGALSVGNNDKLPGVKLSYVAEVKLRAMNSEYPCQCRYDTIDAKSFPIGNETRMRAKGALEWLGAPSREGDTWGRADTKELIFAYPAQLPAVSLNLAACFGSQDSIESAPRFTNAAHKAIEKLHRNTRQNLSEIELRVFSLKKMDKARTKVVFHRNYTAQRLADAANEWEAGCSNLPDIKIRVWGDEKGEWQIVKPKVPFPLQIATCLNRVWKRDGSTECETPVIACTKGIELLLDEQPERFIPQLFTIIVRNGNGLFLSLGASINRNEIIVTKGYGNHKILMPSILGLLLYKLGIKKENYMETVPFLVGRMLKLADELHALYCKEVRNELPPQLVGNALMSAALDSPIQALSQLALRLKPYYGWAQTFRGNESGKLAGYFIGQYGEVAAQLAEKSLSNRFNDAERAQLLLGYLASNKKQ